MGKYIINDFYGKKELTEKIYNIIENAKYYIKASNFLFQDTGTINLLKRVCGEKGIAVFILSNIRGEDSSTHWTINDYTNNTFIQSRLKKIPEKEIKIDNHLSYLKELHEKGLHIHLMDDLHAKFIIADGTDGILMSANFSTGSLSNNTETGLILGSNEIKQLEYVFEELYIHADITLLTEQNLKNLAKRQRKPLPENVFKNHTMESRLRLTVAPSSKETNLGEMNEKSLYRSILKIVNEAENYIYIVTWHFKAIEKLKELLSAIQKALNKGVKISLYSNTEANVESKEASLRAIKILTDMGCNSFGDDNNHSKCIISEKEGILFTANIDGVSGLKSGFEVGCIMTDGERTEAEKHIVKLIKKHDINYGTEYSSNRQ
ncbi:MAG: phospholipase D-like domain-containing protein [Prevotella sp.]|jgi:phosphatidylserine/phosphatidylglycerophosphate/cardiolipin synthase-like enzyme|nr:phospholipase D-like domain-containing protein [Prevotella sp.]